MTIDRDEIKSDYLEWETGIPIRILIKDDPVKEMKNTTDGKKYPVYNIKVENTVLKEVKKIQVFKSQYADMVKQADKKCGFKITSLVGCVFDYKVTIIKVEGKDDKWDTELFLVNCPSDLVQLVGL